MQQRVGIIATILLISLARPATADVINFDNLSLAPESYWNGSGGSGEFESGGATFFNDYNSEFGTWSGFAYSNVTDNTTPGFGNQYSAFAGSGRGSGNDNYGVAFGYGEIDPADPADLRSLPSLSLPAGRRIEGLHVTNDTYPALAMLNGDRFSKKFGGPTGDDPDWFKLTAYGIDAAGNPLTSAVEFYLADYRFSDNSRDYLVDAWEFFDLSELSGAQSLHFNLSSSDVGEFGMNTPSYFAIDDIQVAAVPEPASVFLLGGSLAAGGLWGRFRRRKRA